MQADELDPLALEAVKRQERIPLPHNRLGLKLLRWVTRPLVWYQNRDVPSVGRTVDRTIPGPGGSPSGSTVPRARAGSRRSSTAAGPGSGASRRTTVAVGS